jgi:hypothetical protein
MKMTDEILMAFADNSLPEAERQLVASAVASDPALMARVEGFQRTRQLVQDATASVLNEPVPQRLLDATRQDPFSANPAGPARWGRIFSTGAAMAACVAVGFMLAPRTSHENFVAAPSGLVASGDLAFALSNQPSGETLSGVRLAMTAPSDGGEFCRIFSVQMDNADVNGVACSAGPTWRIVNLDEGVDQDASTAYRTASGAIAPSLLAAMEQRRSGDPLGVDEEAAFLKARKAK